VASSSARDWSIPWASELDGAVQVLLPACAGIATQSPGAEDITNPTWLFGFPDKLLSNLFGGLCRSENAMGTVLGSTGEGVTAPFSSRLFFSEWGVRGFIILSAKNSTCDFKL